MVHNHAVKVYPLEQFLKRHLDPCFRPVPQSGPARMSMYNHVLLRFARTTSEVRQALLLVAFSRSLACPDFLFFFFPLVSPLSPWSIFVLGGFGRPGWVVIPRQVYCVRLESIVCLRGRLCLCLELQLAAIESCSRTSF